MFMLAVVYVALQLLAHYHKEDIKIGEAIL